MKTKGIILACLTFISTSAGANEEFEKIWQSISARSLHLQASAESVKASEINKTRMGNYWMPGLYATGSSYVTNDPGANMFAKLSQRRIEQMDFVPDKLNHPGSQLFNKAAIGFQVPLYTGGMKSSMSEASQFQNEAQKLEHNVNKLFLYSEVAKSYFSLMALERFDFQILRIKKTLESIIDHYQIGNKANMLGHSGLLGLRSLENRILAISDDVHARHASYLLALNELLGGNLVLQSKELNFLEDLNKYFFMDQNHYSESDKVNALKQAANAAKVIVGIEKSKNLPQLSAFAESYAFNGSRKTSTGQSAGITLNWNLFSGDTIGAADEAIHNSHAAEYFAQASLQKEKIEFNSLLEMQSAMLKTIATLEEGQRLLDEQTTISHKLFQNGMINALQLTEVLSRRVDLLKSKSDVELNLIETMSKKILLTKTGTDI